MKYCRICLKSDGDKDIFNLDVEKQEETNRFVDIMLFCLDIVVSRDSKIGTKICQKCYRKIISFEKFKTLAHKNDAYLRTLNLNVDIKNEIFLIDDLKCEDKYSDNECDNDNINCEEKEITDDQKYELLQSEDMLLSVIKTIKYEDTSEECKENDPIKKKVATKRVKTKVPVGGRRGQICEECGKTVRNLKLHLSRHRSISDRRHIKCKMCDKLFSSYSARYKHNRIKHLGIKQHCDICNKDVSSLRAHHLVVHKTEDLPYECVPCGRRFLSQSTLDMHTSVHTKDRPYECDQCEKKFRNKITLVQHIRQVHDKERSHLCQFCSKSFFKKYHLQIHLRSHTKEKPYQCAECEKWYSSKTSLKNHQLIHNNVKMFGCTLCDMTFSKPGEWLTNEQTFHLVLSESVTHRHTQYPNSYVCVVSLGNWIEKLFEGIGQDKRIGKRKGYLRNHMVSHTKEKRYPCKYCGVKFGRSDHKKRHEFTAHERNLGLPRTDGLFNHTPKFGETTPGVQVE